MVDVATVNSSRKKQMKEADGKKMHPSSFSTQNVLDKNTNRLCHRVPRKTLLSPRTDPLPMVLSLYSKEPFSSYTIYGDKDSAPLR